jgi:hypothetical protein
MSSWGLGWKRSSEIFHLTLDYGDFAEEPDQDPSSPPPPPQSPTAATFSPNGDLGFRIELDWSAGDDEDQVALRLQSQLMVALPPPHDVVSVDLRPAKDGEGVGVEMRVVRRREALRSVRVARVLGSTQSTGDGAVVLARLIRSNLAPAPAADGPVAAAGVPVLADHWRSVTALSLCNCGLMVSPSSISPRNLLIPRRFPHVPDYNVEFPDTAVHIGGGFEVFVTKLCTSSNGRCFWLIRIALMLVVVKPWARGV